MVVFEIEPQQLQENNLKSLKIRKNEFKKHLIRSFSLGGYVFIVLLYLKDTSFIRFAVRFVLQSIYTDPFPSQFSTQFTPPTRKRLTRSMYLAAIIVNVLFLIIDLLSGVPMDTQSDYLYGSITLQIIGETRPLTRFSYVYYNLIIAIQQLILIYLTTILNINEEFEKNHQPINKSGFSLNQIEGDGFTGITNITKINPIDIFNQVKSYETDQDNSSESFFVTDRFNLSNMAL